MIAAVCGEIEKTQYGDAQGAQYRGYAAGSRYLVSHGGVADMCILGEPTEGKVVLGHFGSLWLRIGTQGNFIHTAFSEGKRELNSILRMHEVDGGGAGVDPDLGGAIPRTPTAARPRSSTWVRSRAGSAGACRARRTTPTSSSTCASRRPSRCRWRARQVHGHGARAAAAASPRTAIEGEVYVTAPGAEIDEGHPAVAADRRVLTPRSSARRRSAT